MDVILLHDLPSLLVPIHTGNPMGPLVSYFTLLSNTKGFDDILQFIGREPKDGPNYFLKVNLFIRGGRLEPILDELGVQPWCIKLSTIERDNDICPVHESIDAA